MENNAPSGRSYWDLLGAALRALEAGDLPRAERHFELAMEARQQSPGRVFLTEKISDGLARLLRGKADQQVSPGRWGRRSGEFRRRFLQEGEQVVRSAVRLAELRPEDDADTNQPVLEKALYLVGRSRLFSEEPASAVPLLKGLFRTAGKTGRLFDVQLIRHDIPLTEEDRLWLARKGPDMLEEFVANGVLETGSADSAIWVRTILQLLHPRYFGSTGRLEEERAWLEALSTDRMLGRSSESVDLYRAYLKVNPEPGQRPDEARIRLLELLANCEGVHFPVPLYDEALGAMQSAGLSAGSAAGDRYQLALERMDYRRPDPEPGTAGAAWASAGLEPDGRVAVVFWWKDQPRDLAFWSAGDDPGPMVRFLEPCAGRIIATEPAVVETLGAAWQDTPAVWTVRDFATAFLEPFLGDRGVDEETFLRIGLGESGPWRTGWNADLGHTLLKPPRRSALVETWRQETAAAALLGGLVWRAVLSRIEHSDPSLRAGIGALARRGDPAADFLYDFLNLDQGQGQSIDSSFQPWTLPLLWTRPDPFVWSAGGGAAAEPESGSRPDLGHNDLAIVTTGDPGAVLTAWGDGRQKWRVVLDRLDRLAALARVAVSAIGPVTLIPAGGQVHSLRAGLALLETLLTREGRPAGQVAGLLPLFHWVRLVETHNGDLLDFRQVRPRPAAAVALFESYQELVADLELVAPVLEPGEDVDPWAAQFSQRVRKAGLVAGLADGLTLDAHRLDSLWGVFEGSDASWVFLDSAAIHWYLLSRQGLGIQELHALLHTRGRRHLSMLVGAVWMRSELEDLLGTWLGVFGSPYCLALTNLAAPLLRLADQGVVPDAVHLAVEAHAAPVAQVAESVDLAGSGTVLLPAFGSHRDLWRRIANGELGIGKRSWRFLDPGQASDTALPAQECAGATKLLLVPVLDSLSDHAMPIAQEDTRQEWARADKDRSLYLLWRRRLCGLEMASLLAGPWETVEILDCRWWRILDPEADGSGHPDPAPWTGERALALAAPGAGRLFNLPGVGPGQGRTIHPNTLETVRHWHAGKAPAAVVASAPQPALPGDGKILLALQEPGTVWEPMLTPVARAWEQGRTDRWLLLVSRWMPEQGAAVVAAGYSPGISVWTPDRVGHRPAPVLWCEAGDLEDPDLKAFLRQAPPASVLALDVQDWLPSAERTGQHGAAALRALLDLPVQRLVLQAAAMKGPWATFLAREAGARVLGQTASSAHGPVGAATPALPPVASPRDPAVLPDSGRALTPDVIVRRMRRLLENPGSALLPRAGSGADGPAESPPPGRQLVALDRLGFLAGLSADQVASCFRLLRWVARFSGDSLSNAGLDSAAEARFRPSSQEARPGHGLLINRRYAELENQLAKLEQQLPVLLPLLLGAHRPGLLTWADLEFPPAQLPAAEMELLDGFLAACARSRGHELGLVYDCPRGSLNSTRRLIGAVSGPAQAQAGLLRLLDLFRGRLKDVMASAVETGEGFLVETGLTDLRDEEREFLALGSALGFWRWVGPACPGALHLVDLLTTAASPTVRQGVTCWDLLADELTLAAVSRAAAAAPSGVPEEKPVREASRWPAGGLRAMLPGGGKADELDGVADRVCALAHPQGEPGLLVITGLAGTGRHQALARGLQQAAAGAGVLGEITVFSPDAAAASHFLAECRIEGEGSLLPEVRIIGPGAGPARPNRLAGGANPGADSVVVMLEIQRFEAETRYQIAQLGRGRRLIMTTDPASAAEPWEHLFLTVPRASEVVRLEAQRTVSRRIWAEVRQLLPEELRGKGQSLVNQKGQIEAVYAVNLDQCLVRMFQEVEAGTLPQHFRLVGPLASDLDFLAGAMRERGWLAVAEKDLDALLLPGPRELLAGVACLLGSAGVLARQYPLPEAQEGSGKKSASLTTGEALRTLAGAFVGPQGRSGLAAWLDRCRELDAGLTFGEFFAELETWPWARSVLADPGAAARALALRDAWTRITVADLPGEPLWEAWWYTVTRGSALLGAGARRPLVTLAAAGEHSGPVAEAGVYLCLGTELPRQHYSVLSRLSDRALILYKERSPLVSEAND